MKMKRIEFAGATLFALALLPMAQATQITGTVTFGDSVKLGSNGAPVSVVAAANEVLNWYVSTGTSASNPDVTTSGGNLAAAFHTPVTFATSAGFWSASEFVELRGFGW